MREGERKRNNRKDDSKQVNEGIEWSQKALQRETASPQGMQSRCHLYIGIGHSMLSANTIVKQDKVHHTNTALDCFQKYISGEAALTL